MSENTQWEARLDLPSHFAPYDFDEVQMRSMSVGVVKQVRAYANGGTNKHLAEIVRPCYSIDPAQLTLGDFWYTLAWLRLNTFSNVPLVVEWECPVCGHKNTESLDLQGIPIDELPDDFQEPIYITTSRGVEFPVRLYRVRDEIATEKYLERKYKGEYTAADEQLVDLAAVWVHDGTLADKHAALESGDVLSPQDIEEVRAALATLRHGPRATMTSTCKERDCGYTADAIPVRFQLQRLVPSPEEIRRFAAPAIRFGAVRESASDG